MKIDTFDPRAEEYNENTIRWRLGMTEHPAEELSFPSHSVTLVKDSGHPSARLPVPCDACDRTISNYPYIAKHSTNGHHRKYHVACALRIGVVSNDPTLPKKEASFA